MARVSRHYERAFEAYLVRSRIPHVIVDDVRRADRPEAERDPRPPVSPSRLELGAGDALAPGGGGLKSFDAVVYGRSGTASGRASGTVSGAASKAASGAESGESGTVGPHLLIELKGRRVDLNRPISGSSPAVVRRRECWTTAEDIESLRAWTGLFGLPYEGVLLFWYWLDGPSLRAGERETFRFEGRVYAHRAVRLADYARLMRARSSRWGTVHLTAADFESVARPLGALLSGRSAGTPAERASAALFDGLPPARKKGRIEGQNGGQIGEQHGGRSSGAVERPARARGGPPVAGGAGVA